jgi:hypothetical protein
MKDTKMHEGLTGKEMRNFYQETLVTYYARELANSEKLKEANLEVYKQKSDDKFDVIRRAIKLSENNLAFAQEDLKLRECRLGLLQTLDVGLGWSEHDVSDYVACSGKHYRSFIGTTEEYENFIKQFDK